MELYSITPDKYNDEPVLYQEDIIDILTAKQMIIKGEAKLRRREEGKQRARSKRKF